jgi:hypothetical protein
LVPSTVAKAMSWCDPGATIRSPSTCRRARRRR